MDDDITRDEEQAIERANDLLADALSHAQTYASHDEVRPSAIMGFNKVQEAHDALCEVDSTRGGTE